MGLDTVEMLFAIEEHFGIEVSNETAATLDTVRDMHDCVCGELQRQGRPYDPAQVFEELRLVISKQAGVDIRRVTLEASFVYDLKMD